METSQLNLLDRWVTLLKPFGFSERIVKWSFLTTVSALLENRCWLFDNGGSHIYPTLYTLIVAAPACFKTTTCDRSIEDLLFPIISEVDGPYFGPTIASPAGLLRAFKRNNMKNVANKYQSSPMFVYAPEWTQFYRDIGGGELIHDLLGFYDPKPPGRSWYKEIVKNEGPSEIISPALTILGCTTVKGIVESRMMQYASTGIVSRFIFVHEPKRPKGCRTRPNIKQSNELKIIQTSLLVIRAMKGEFQLTPEAETLLGDLVEHNLLWNEKNPADTLFAHYMARRSTQIKKLAMIISAISRKTMVIEPEDLKIADRLLCDIEPHMPAAFGTQIIRNDPGLMNKLADRIPPSGCTEAELLQKFVEDGQILPKGTEYHDAIAGLLGLNWAIKSVDKATGLVTFKRTGVYRG